jgi:hypothetical protein
MTGLVVNVFGDRLRARLRRANAAEEPGRASLGAAGPGDQAPG